MSAPIAGHASVRRAVLADLDFIVKCNIGCARESEGLELDPEQAHLGALAVFEKPERGTYFVAEAEDGQLIGSLLVTFEWSDWRNQEIWWLQSVYVSQLRRGQGVFTALYQEVEKLARKENAAEVRLYLDKHNERAKSAYQKLGFQDSHYAIMTVELKK